MKGFVLPKMEESSCPVLIQVEEVMDGAPEEASRVTPFTELIPYYPLDRIYLETKPGVEWDNVAAGCGFGFPVGFGQRGLIVAPPRTGKTVLQQGINSGAQGEQPTSPSHRAAG